MAVNDLILLSQSPFGSSGTQKYAVAASATIIYPGEPVAQAEGGYVVTQMATSKPVAGTDYLAGVAMSTSTNTASAAGTVEVMPINPYQIWLAKPTTAASWDTQAEYDLLVGDRVIMALSSGNFTIGHTDGATYGCVIQPLDIAKWPGRVAFKFRAQVCGVEANYE